MSLDPGWSEVRDATATDDGFVLAAQLARVLYYLMESFEPLQAVGIFMKVSMLVTPLAHAIAEAKVFMHRALTFESRRWNSAFLSESMRA